MADFTPHTDAEVASMLATIGLSSLDELFAVIPEALRLAGGLDVAPGLSEVDVLERVGAVAAANRPAGRDLVCFAGGGAYEHDVPSVVRRVAFRSEFVTAYTPYQPEVAQGVLQALFEYQTVVCRLFGMDVANASLYDGATACVEAVNLAVAATGRSTVWVSRGVHPHTRQVLATFAAGTGHDLVDVALVDGITAWRDDDGQPALRSEGRSGPAPRSEGRSGPAPRSEGRSGPAHRSGPPAALLVQYPNYLGCVEELTVAAEVARRNGALLLVSCDPVSVGLLRSPGDHGADVVVGEGQPFGTPLSFGGPYLGMFACRRDLVRRLPGRLVGETVDVDGRRAYVTTLRTREQDIRREKASSNVCTNQTLIAVAAIVHLAWLGTGGLREMALRCARGTRYAREAVLGIDGVEPLADAPVLREFAVRLPVAAETAVERMADAGFLAGIPLGPGYTSDGDENGLLIAVTERRTRAEIDGFAAALQKVVT